MTGELRLPNLGLVRPGITFEVAKRYYSWSGMLIEFYDARPGSELHPPYVALDPASRTQRSVRSSIGLMVVDTTVQSSGCALLTSSAFIDDAAYSVKPLAASSRVGLRAFHRFCFEYRLRGIG